MPCRHTSVVYPPARSFHAPPVTASPVQLLPVAHFFFPCPTVTPPATAPLPLLTSKDDRLRGRRTAAALPPPAEPLPNRHVPSTTGKAAAWEAGNPELQLRAPCFARSLLGVRGSGAPRCRFTGSGGGARLPLLPLLPHLPSMPPQHGLRRSRHAP